MAESKKGYNTPKVELIKIDDSDLILTSPANGNNADRGHGNGHGGGCDGIPGHNGEGRTSNHGQGCY